MYKSIQNIFLLYAVLVFVFGCGPAKTLVRPVVEPRYYVLVELCEDNKVVWQWDYLTQMVTLSKGDSQAKVLVGSNQVIVQGQPLTLSEPVKMVQSVILVPTDFNLQVMKRLKSVRKPDFKSRDYAKRIERKKDIRKIIIDAGHGGKDPGAIGASGTHEKEIVLDISKRLYSILRKEGFDVTLTRDDDTFISLQKRTEIASQHKADLFVSIHANSSRSRNARGVEVFSSKSLTFSDKNEEQRIKNHRLLFKELNMKSDQNVGKIVSDLLYDYKIAESTVVAKTIADNMHRGMKTKLRGTKESRFFVLRNNLMPAVLVEVGFLSNYREEKLLKGAGYRQRTAAAIAKGIKDYVRTN